MVHAADQHAPSLAAVCDAPSLTTPSKTLATWLAIVGGGIGANRFYLHGWRDPWAWLHLPPTLAGCVGAVRMNLLGQDDRTAWLLVPVLGVMLSLAMFEAILCGLTPDERWRDRFHPNTPVRRTAWGPVLGVIVALMVGGALLMSTIAYAGHRFFEWQLVHQAAARAQNSERLRA